MQYIHYHTCSLLPCPSSVHRVQWHFRLSPTKVKEYNLVTVNILRSSSMLMVVKRHAKNKAKETVKRTSQSLQKCRAVLPRYCYVFIRLSLSISKVGAILYTIHCGQKVGQHLIITVKQVKVKQVKQEQSQCLRTAAYQIS